jgi:DNA-binding ferritin-like protein (Dps family)
MIDKSLLKSGAVEENMIAMLKHKLGAYEQAGMQETDIYKETLRQYEEYMQGKTFSEVIGKEFSETFDNVINELTKGPELDDE